MLKLPSSLARKYVSNLIWGPLSNFIFGAVGIFIMPILIKLLGKEDFGLLKIFELLTLNGVASLLEFGVQASLIKSTASGNALEMQDEINKFFAAAFFILFIIALITSILCFSFRDSIMIVIGVDSSSLRYADFRQALGFLFLTYPLMFTSLSFTGVLQGMHEISIVRRVDLGLNLARSVLSLFFVIQFKTVTSLFSLYTYYYVINFIIQFLVCYKFLPMLSFNPCNISLKYVKKILRSSGWFYLNSLSGLSYRQLGALFISSYMGPSALANYEIATKFPYFMKGILGRINEVLVPLSSYLGTLNSKDHGQLGAFFSSILLMQLSISVCLVTYFFFNGNELLLYWMGGDLDQVSYFLRLSSLFLVVIPFANIGSGILLGSGINVKRLTVFSLVGVLINLLFCKYLIIDHGIVAAIFGTLFQYVIYSMLIYLFALKSLEIKYIKILWTTIAIAIVDIIFWLIVDVCFPVSNKLEFVLKAIIGGGIMITLNLLIAIPREIKENLYVEIKKNVHNN